ncbi:MAG: dTMP kinase [Candidatus Moranbacteria bacterium]|nr:dTMP kinase [Candidatus Moranbacteria bacterium]
MIKKQKKGRFIVFEGLDGSGQSTQVDLLNKYLKSKGEKTHLTAEPTNNIIGGLIRGLLTKQWSLSNTGMQLLYCADRAHHLESEVYPALEAGNTVISSRYFFSTIAFGALDPNNSVEWLKTLNEKFPEPDATFFLRVSAKKCIERIENSRFRKEFFEKEKKLEKVLRVYDEIVKDKDFKTFYVIDGEQPIEKVHQDVVDVLNKK